MQWYCFGQKIEDVLQRRNIFSFEDIDGELAEARLHRDKGYVGFPLRDAMRYAMKQGWSDCTLILVGNPDTTLALI